MRRFYPLFLIVLAFGFSLAVYSRLPDRIPLHWNWEGEVDRFGGRLEGAFLLPAIVLVVWLVMRFLPGIDPRRANYEKFAGTYDTVVNGALTLLVAIHIIVLGNALGWPIPLERTTPVLVGILLIVIGNVLPRTRSNWWLGIRTPWTLSSERVWRETHRLGGYLMFGSGILMLLSAALPTPWLWIGVGAVIASSAISIFYSYVLWKKERPS
jgi:uncharacterized membrane protein